MKRQFQAFSYKVENKADDTLDVHIDGIIVDAETQQILKDWFGDETSVSYKSFRDQVTTAKPKTINLYVNSGGGMVTDAMAIRDFLASQEAAGVKVKRTGRGVVASAATFLVMGNNSVLSENSWFMIHNVSGGVYGDVNMIESYARAIRKFNDAVSSVYMKATGLSATVIGNMMDQETWMTAQEAKDKGFVNAIEGAATFTNKISPDAWPYSNQAVLNLYNAAVKDPKDAGGDHKSFFTDIKSEFMKLFDSLKTSIAGAKADKKFENLAGRDEILALVESVLTPYSKSLDDAIGAIKKEDVEEEVEEEATDPKEKKIIEDKKKLEDKKAADKKAKELENKKKLANKTDDDEEGEDAADPRVAKLEKELENLRLSIANKKSKPESADPLNDKDEKLFNKVKIKYEEED